MDVKKRFIIILIIGIVLLLGFYLITRSISNLTGFSITSTITGASVQSTGERDILAKCLTEKGIKMYGTYKCGYCNSQKQMFSESFQYIDYIECDSAGENAAPSTCQEAGVNAYPTWIINNKKYEGEQSLNKLKQISEC